MKHLLVIFTLLFIGCSDDVWESRIVAKGTIESNCELRTFQGNHTLTCVEKKFFLKMYDGVLSSYDTCYVSDEEYNMASIGMIYTCRLKKE